MRDSEDYQGLRQLMVKQQLMSRGIRDGPTLRAMAQVPRHLFVPHYLQNEAYNDYPLPIGHEQTISQPYIVAYMTEALELKGGERVLEIGTGSGYQAAILSLVAREVYTVELIPELAQAAQERLNALRYTNIHIRVGDGFFGWSEEAPFDAIIVTATAPVLPKPLRTQLAELGRLIIPIGASAETQILTLFRKMPRGLVKSELEPVRFVPMRGEIEKTSDAQGT